MVDDNRPGVDTPGRLASTRVGVSGAGLQEAGEPCDLRLWARGCLRTTSHQNDRSASRTCRPKAPARAGPGSSRHL